MSTTPLNLILVKSQRGQILAVGVAILFGYFLNFVTVSMLELIGKLPLANRVKLYISRIMYIFGVAGMASTCSLPGLYGVFHVVMAWISFLALFVLHIVYVLNFNDVKGMKRGIAMGFFWVSVTVWWWGIMVLFLKDTKGL